MTEDIVKLARLMKVTDTVVDELDRQGFLEVLAAGGLDVTELVRAVIEAADGDVVPFRRSPPTVAPSEVARLMKVTEAVITELYRQGIGDQVADRFDPAEMAKAVIKVADDDAVPLKR